MAAVRQSVAYQNTSPKTAPLEQERPVENTKKRSAGKRALAIKYFMMAAVMFGVVMCIITSYMRVTELTSQASRLRTQLANLQSEENALSAKREKLFNLEYVESVAINQLGMVKQDKFNVTYVSISSPEKVTIASSEGQASQAVSGIVKSFNAVVEYLK